MLSRGQQLAIEQVRRIEAAAEGGSLEVLAVRPPAERGGRAAIDISLDCTHLALAADGLPLHQREQFTLTIAEDFPFDPPAVWTRHTRFAGFPHVQWKRHLCLYQAPATEWDPSDGMFGFVERLGAFLEQGGAAQLDPVGAPLHPPVTYLPKGPVRTVVPRSDAPVVGDRPWFGAAHLRIVSEARVDILGWSALLADDVPQGVAAAVLLSEPLPFEFPDQVGALIEELAARGVPRDLLLLTLQSAVLRNDDGSPLYVVVGTPMRGIRGGERRQHLTAWYVEPWVAKALRLALHKYSEFESLREIGQEVEDIILRWAAGAEVAWCSVREDRPEIVTRRDHSTPLAWFAGRSITLWGCGALGGYVADALVRAGVRKLTLRDNKTVAPGVLVRQLFDDADIGRWKAEALADRLRRIRPDVEIEVHTSNLLRSPLDDDDWTDRADVVIDTTASLQVLKKLELRRRVIRSPRIPVVSMVIDRSAMHGLCVLARAGHTGGPADVTRRAQLAAYNRPTLKQFVEAFWPTMPPRDLFQPEPGCSDPTFIGSAADVGALASLMLNQTAEGLAADTSESAVARLISQSRGTPSGGRVATRLGWVADHISLDPDAEYEIRIADAAWREITAWIEQSHRRRGPEVETGGLLFGERDDALGVIWVTEVSGPPPDSEQSPSGFVCGTQGVASLATEKRTRTCGRVQFLGMWHTHPEGSPLPSPTDLDGMARVLAASTSPSARSLLVIVSPSRSRATTVGAFVFSSTDVTSLATGSAARRCEVRRVATRLRSRCVGLALSGGGSRAIAFHLGCLRALHDRGVLSRVRVISAVSGGSVIAAMYAYTDVPFPGFEQRVLDLLRRGLVGDLVRELLRPRHLVSALGSVVAADGTAVGSDAARLLLTGGARLLGRSRDDATRRWRHIQPPLSRWATRTTAFEAALARLLFGETMVTSPRRDGLDIVLNACELRTGSAFRFGSMESRCWRFGRVKDNDVSVAQAVAASAAYPLFLPAIDRTYVFTDRDVERQERVILTDGGVYDNLGLTCLEPGRSAEFSSNVFQPDYIVACDAGAGQFSDHVFPSWWLTRVTRSFETTFRKNLNAAYQRLHEFESTGLLKGFVLAYLGQMDHRLPHRPPDLVRREAAMDYPTNFSPMTDVDIETISRRGEQLTRLLIEHYVPEL